MNIYTQTGYGTTSVWCRGGSSYVERCWGFPYLKIKRFRFSWFLVLDFWFHGFIVLWFYGFVIILWFYNYYLGSESFILLKDFNVNSLLSWGVNNSDLLIIFYIFLCLQLAGLSEFKQRQDYLVVAFISLIFTPIGLLFIKDETDKDDK